MRRVLGYILVLSLLTSTGFALGLFISGEGSPTRLGGGIQFPLVTNAPLDLNVAAGLGVKVEFGQPPSVWGSLFAKTSIATKVGPVSPELAFIYEPLFALNPPTFVNRGAVGVGLREPLGILLKLGWDLYYNSWYFGASISYNFGTVPQKSALADYGISEERLAEISLNAQGSLRAGQRDPSVSVKVSGVEFLEPVLKENSVELYIGFAQDWRMAENGFCVLKLTQAKEQSSVLSGVDIKKFQMTQGPLSAAAKFNSVYVIGYKIGAAPLQTLRKPIKLLSDKVELSILPGKNAELVAAKDGMGVNVLKEPIFADQYSANQVTLKDEFGNEFTLTGNFLIPLTKAGMDNQTDLSGIFGASYIDVKVRFGKRVFPNPNKIANFKATFNRAEMKVGESVELKIDSFKDVYGNDFGNIDIIGLSSEDQQGWEFEPGRSSQNGRFFTTKRIGLGERWLVTLRDSFGNEFKRSFTARLLVLPNLANLSLKLDNLPDIVADRNGLANISISPLRVTDNFGNDARVMSVQLRGLPGELEVDFGGSRIRYSLTKAETVSERDFASRTLKLYFPTIAREVTVDAKELGSFTITVRVVPNVPVRLDLKPNITSLVFPTFFGSSFQREFSFEAYDTYGNRVSNDQISLSTSSTEISQVLKLDGNRIIVSNIDVRKPMTDSIILRSKSDGRELSRISVSFVPILRVLELDEKGVEKLGYNLYRATFKAHDGNGNPYSGSHKIIINGALERTLNFKDGTASLEFSSHALGLKSIEAVVKPELQEINYREPERKINLLKNFFALEKTKPSGLVFEAQVNNPRNRENAYGPVPSYTGNYVAYFVVRQDGSPGLVVKGINSEFEEDVLGTAAGTRRRGTGTSTEVRQETVYSYTWVPMRDILVYTPFVDGAFNIYAYNVSTKQRKELYKSAKNNTDVNFDLEGRMAVWVSGGTLMVADVDYSDGISFRNVRELHKIPQETIIQPSLSPSGERVAFVVGNDLFIYDIPTKKQYRVTNDLPSESEPVWSPDGRYLAYYKKIGNEYSLFISDAQSILEGRNPREIQAYREIAYDFGKPVWVSTDELVFAANDVPSSEESISLYEVSTGKVSRIRVSHELAAAFTYFSIIPFMSNGRYELKAVYGAFVGREAVFLGRLNR